MVTFVLTSLVGTVAAQYPDLAKGRQLPVLDARVGPNIRLGEDPRALPANQRGQAEPHLVRHLLDPEVILATYQEGRFPDGGAMSCGYAVSTDGGLSWRRALTPQLTTLTGGRFTRATDPVAGAGPQGELYLQALGSTQGAFDHAAVVVSRSLDRGATWSSPVTVFESSGTVAPPDKNWLAVQDFAGAPNAGRLVSTWTGIAYADGRTQSAHLLSAFSDDRGQTWSAPVNITPVGTFHQGTQPLFLSDGTLAVIYMTFLNTTGGTTYDLRCKRSLDGGRTYPANATTVVPSILAWNDPQVRDGEYLPSAAVARQSGEIFVTYVGMVGGSPRVLVTSSANRGTTWTSPVIASDQPAGVSVMNPSVAATPDGRTVVVFYMDKRHAPEARDFVDFTAAMSFDGGQTWAPNVRLSELSSELRLGPSSSLGTMLGDYFALIPPATATQPFVAIWCDTRTGESEPMITRIAARPAADFNAWSIARFAGNTPADAALPARDSDGDGFSNLAEFHLGTDPLRPEPGQTLVIRPRNANSDDALWLERANVPERTLTVQAQHPLAERSLSGTDLAAAELPEESPAGLVWRGVRFSPTPGESVEYSLGRRVAGDPGSSTVWVSEGQYANTRTNSQLVNLSVRSQAGPDPAQMIVGFAVAGRRSLLVRAAGPALAGFGVDGILGDPRLSVNSTGWSAPRLNDNWADGGATASLFARLGAFPFLPGSADAGLTVELVSQSATAAVTNGINANGITLVEVYDADSTRGAAADSRLVNLSARAEAGDGRNTLVAGFVLAGTQPRRVLLRAVGPGLRAQGVASPLADPSLSIWQGNSLLAANDDWSTGRSPAALSAAAEAVAAFPFAKNSLDAALLLTLPAGAYTVVVAGAEAQSGAALVEIYDVN